MFRLHPQRQEPSNPLPPARGGARSLRQMLAGMLILVLAGMSLVVVTSASAAVAVANPTDASKFRGVNWARLSNPGSWADNFCNCTLVLQGLSGSDDYATTRTKADKILAAFSAFGANTVRMPVNWQTVTGSWWGSYKGAIDAATTKGMYVDLSFWGDDGVVSTGGRIADPQKWNAMWTAIINDYKDNSLVYFNPYQEPVGYSITEAKDLLAQWLADHSDAPRNRVFIPGTGYQKDISHFCGDSRFDGTYLAYHRYGFDTSPSSYDWWVNEITSHLGPESCSPRTIVEEYGADMNTGLDYNDPNSTHANVTYLRAMTDIIHDRQLGAITWNGLGGRNIAGGYEPFNLQRLTPNSSGGLPLWTPNTSGIDRLRYAWRVGPPSGTSLLKNGASSNDCMDVYGASTAPISDVIAYPCHGRANQQWTRRPSGPNTGEISVYTGAQRMCLDAAYYGTANGTPIIVHPCQGQTNQQWIFYSDGTIRGVASGRCLDRDVNTGKVQLWDCWGGDNQKWRLASQ